MNTYTEVELKRLKNIQSIKRSSSALNLAMFGWSNVTAGRVFHRLTVEGKSSHIVVGISGYTSLGGNF